MSHTHIYEEEQYMYQGLSCTICGRNDKCKRCQTKSWKRECDICFRALCIGCSKKYKHAYVCNKDECIIEYKNDREHQREKNKLGIK